MYDVRLTIGLCLAFLLSGCDSPSAPERFDPVGTLSFTYQGATLSGTFQATGEMQLSGSTIPQPVTGATAYRQENQLNLLAFRTQSASRGDAFSLLLGEVTTTGPLSLDPLACQQQASANCRVGFFVPDVDSAELTSVTDLSVLLQKSYVLVLGSINVTSRTDLRVRGTFQAVAFRANEQSLQNALTISNGEFDLPVRPQQ
jgi:hypothetical protein